VFWVQAVGDVCYNSPGYISSSTFGVNDGLEGLGIAEGYMLSMNSIPTNNYSTTLRVQTDDGSARICIAHVTPYSSHLEITWDETGPST
jgi:hypothetical protein